MAFVAANRSSITSRLVGIAADVALLAMFLTLGVLFLNILIQFIVLCVGAYRDLTLDVSQAATEPRRVATDFKDLIIAVVSAGAGWFVYRGFLGLRRRYIHLFVGSRFESFVSQRYLLARDGGRLVGLITIVSVLGVAVGTMALIVVLSVMEGFDQALRKKFMGVFSHLEIAPDPFYARVREIPADEWRRLIVEFKKIPGVKGVAPLVTHQSIAQARLGVGEYYSPAVFRGVDPELEMQVSDILQTVVEGKNKPGLREAVIGRELARRLAVNLGDTIFAIGRLIPEANSTNAKTSKLKVVGIFESGLYDVDSTFVYTNLQTVQNILLLEGEVGSIHMSLFNPDDADRVGQATLALIPKGYGYRRWQDLNPQFFEALWMEKVAMFIILLLIVLVAALNIIGTLVMTVVQKTRDIGILKSMGAESSSILWIFLSHGFLIGLVGTSLGTVWGLRVCHFVSNDIEKIFRLPGGVYGLDRLPVIVEPRAIAFMAGCALLTCVLASIIPALQAARLNPVEALRYDA